jgi:predicted lysophospholipase L1 biosynthesis ABC-type transport system permease subunit
MVVSLIGMVAVLLAGVGIIGLVAFTVSQRTKEIAIRIALGARKVQVLAAVLRQFAWPVALGLVAGTGIAAAASRVLRKALFGVNNLDPLSYARALHPCSNSCASRSAPCAPRAAAGPRKNVALRVRRQARVSATPDKLFIPLRFRTSRCRYLG